MKTPKPNSVRDDPNNAQGAVPFSYDSAPSPEAPEFHIPGAVFNEIPGVHNDVDFGSVAPEKNPRRAAQETWQTPANDGDMPTWMA